MQVALSKGAVALGGLITSLIVIAAIGLGPAEFDPLGMFVWVFVPAGAMFTGAVSASGYYVAAKLFHQPPRRFLLAHIVVVAAVTPVLIYLVQYLMAMTSDGVPVRQFLSLPQFVDLVITHSHMSMSMVPESGDAVGQFGYLMVALEWIGFVLGAASIYAFLRGEPRCGACRNYLRTLARKYDSFEDEDAFSAYYNHVYDHPVTSPEFALHAGTVHQGRKLRPGAFRMTTTVLGCPSCGTQFISERASYWGNRGFQPEGGLARSFRMPAGVDVASIYQ